jgi:multidrug resistance efflux pump
MSEMAGNSSLSERVRSLRLDEGGEPTGGGLWWLPWAICVVLVLVSAFFAMEVMSPIDDDMVKKLAEERKLFAVKTESPSASLDKLGVTSTGDTKTEIALEAKGYIVPFSLIQISPKIGGTVIELRIWEGKAVKKGELLAVVEDVDYQGTDKLRAIGSVAAAQGRLDELTKYLPDEIDQAKADLEEAKAQLEQMQAKWDRTMSLKDRNAVADEDYEAAKSAKDSMRFRVDRLGVTLKLLMEGTRKAKIDAVKGELAQAKADLEKAEWRFKYREVTAPIDGIVLSKKTEEGNIVNPSAFSNGLSASLCEMADLHNLEVDLSIAERDISRLFVDQDCRIRAEAFPNRVYKGKVSRIMPIGDRSKSSVPVRVKIDFPAIDAQAEGQGEFLRPEMGAIVTFLNRKAPEPKK